MYYQKMMHVKDVVASPKRNYECPFLGGYCNRVTLRCPIDVKDRADRVMDQLQVYIMAREQASTTHPFTLNEL